jgi:hypothetical protein
MEAEAVRRLIQWLEENGILHMLGGLVMDQDSSVDSLLKHDARIQTLGLDIYLDPGLCLCGGCLRQRFQATSAKTSEPS